MLSLPYRQYILGAFSNFDLYTGFLMHCEVFQFWHPSQGYRSFTKVKRLKIIQNKQRD